MSKIKVQENIDIFKCPICGSNMDIDNLKSLICTNKHCFDLSKEGYLNFLQKPVKTDYNKEMFRSRTIISNSNFFEPMIDKVSEIIEKHIDREPDETIRMLDAGCGEGSHIHQIKNKLYHKNFSNIEMVGIDISKEGIKIAAKQYPQGVWCVGDLARNPFMSRKFDIILNILSPSNYSEFNRIISGTGLLIKVVPGSSYLKELRELFYDRKEKQEYSNEKVIKHFANNFNLIDTESILYTLELNKEKLEHLIRMTPLSWGTTGERIQKALHIGLDKITVDFTIIYGFPPQELI